MFRSVWLTGMLLALAAIGTVAVAERPMLPNLFPFPNASGILRTFSATGDVDLTGPFFQSLGTNGRMCASCHLPDQGWTISAQAVAHR
jgi:cytochrome c peroxidase